MSLPRIKTVRFVDWTYDSNTWRVLWPLVLTDDQGQPELGRCLFDDKQLYIATKDQSSREMVSTAVHEVIHATCRDLDEAAVARAEDAVMAVLTALKVVPEK